MSRSTRKPIWTQGYGGKARALEKRKANNRVKRVDVPSGSAFKKVYSSYDICDFRMPADPASAKPWKVRCK